MKNKKGISLVVLIVTIIVMFILASVVIFVSNDAVNNSKKATFATDLNEIEDLIDEYYLNNNALPVVSGNLYSKTQVVDLISEGADVLSTEITSNGDDLAVFYEVDLSKLPISDSKNGTKKDGDATDVYLVSGQNLNVYYLKGQEIAGDYYFSLTEKLTGKNKVDSNNVSDSSNITISNITDAIKLTKSTNDWTNELKIKVQTTLETDETLEYLVSGQVINTSTSGEFEINVSDILTNDTTLMNTFYNSDANKVVTINKYVDESGTNKLIASSNISISNLDMLSANVVSSGNITYTKYNDFILANISGYSDLGGSGVKEVRVLYTTKLDANGSAVSYYENTPSEITASYINNAGKSFNPSMIKLPTDVTEYALIVIDNAGNLSTPSLYTVTY